MPSVLRELRTAARSLGRSPGYAATAVLSLALALALTTTAFLVVDAVRHPYTPVPDADRLVTLGVQTGDPDIRVSAYDLHDQLRASSGALEGVSVVAWRGAVLRAGPLGGEGAVGVVGPEFFRVTGVRPALGRAFSRDASSSEEAGVVVSERTWRRLFAGRARVDGAALTVGDRTYPVVGVMPRGFAVPWPMDAWLLRPERETRRPRYALAVGRLRAGASTARVRAEVAAAAGRILGRGQAAPLRPVVLPTARRPAQLQTFHLGLSGAALAVLLIACANLANLTLARGLSRRRELALRTSLGATRGRLVRQLLAESVLVAAGGAALGVLAATWGAELLAARMPAEVPLLGELAPRPSWRVLAGCALTTILVIAGTGVLPALRASEAAIARVLQDGAGTTTGRPRAHYAGLVVAEVALSLALLMAAGLLVRAARNVDRFDFGYDARTVAAADVRLPKDQRLDPARAERAYAELAERARRVPGVRVAATMQWALPDDDFGVRGDERRVAATRAVARVSPDFLRTLGVGVVRGRDFTAGDETGEGAAIVDERAARALWPNADAVGRMVAVGTSDGGPWLRVVGVIPNVHLGFQAEPELEPDPQVFVAGGPALPGDRRLLVRAATSPSAVTLAALRAELQAGVAGGAVGPVRPWYDGFERRRAMHRFVSGVFGLFGAAALLLAAVGQYGVLAFAVGQRTREFGVRLALGARPAAVFRRVLRDGAVLLLAGTAAGAVLAMWTAQLLGAWLYGLPATDAWSLVLAEGALTTVSLAACSVPAWRATRADPVDVLREA